MSSINGVGALIFSNPAFQANSGTGSNSGCGTNTDTLADSLGKTVPAQLVGQAFAMTLSQQVGSNGVDDDSVIFESSGQTSSGGYATVSISSGNSFSSAFASMLANFQDASPAITDGANTTMDQLGQSADGLGGVLGQLAAELQNSNSDGTAGVGEEMLPLSANVLSAPSDSNAPADGMLSFFNSIIASLDAGLQNPIADSGSNTIVAATNTSNTGNSSNPNNTVA